MKTVLATALALLFPVVSMALPVGTILKGKGTYEHQTEQRNDYGRCTELQVTTADWVTIKCNLFNGEEVDLYMPNWGEQVPYHSDTRIEDGGRRYYDVQLKQNRIVIKAIETEEEHAYTWEFTTDVLK